MRFLTAVPVYNEAKHVAEVLQRICASTDDVLVVDDGSTDGTPEVLASLDGITIVRHAKNRGYGAALRTAFEYAEQQGYEFVVTIDCDGQHDPSLIRDLIAQSHGWDVVSGSRYLSTFAEDDSAPASRQAINRQITAELNQEFGLKLTDAFCGFKAYRVESLRRLELTLDGYAMPLEFWVQAAAAGLKIHEVPVPRIYLDASRTFGGSLDDPDFRLRHYREVIRDSRARAVARQNAWMCDEFAWTSGTVSST